MKVTFLQNNKLCQVWEWSWTDWWDMDFGLKRNGKLCSLAHLLPAVWKRMQWPWQDPISSTIVMCVCMCAINKVLFFHLRSFMKQFSSEWTRTTAAGATQNQRAGSRNQNIVKFLCGDVWGFMKRKRTSFVLWRANQLLHTVSCIPVSVSCFLPFTCQTSWDV